MYPVSEDSLFLARILGDYIFKTGRNKGKIKYLDMGTGTGILSETAFKAGIKKDNITAVDIEDLCVGHVKNQGFCTIKSDLFSNLKKQKFDLITFNAPYLPKDKFDNEKDTTGGKKGDEASLRFIKQAKMHLNKGGKIFLLISSLTPFSRIERFKPEIVAKRKIFFEELIILEF